MIKKVLLSFFSTLCLSIVSLFSQNNMFDEQWECFKDTAVLHIDKIETYLYNKNTSHINNTIIIYIIKAHNANGKDNSYKGQQIIISIDTIKAYKTVKHFYSIKKRNCCQVIYEGSDYLFHLELYGCLPMVLGIDLSYFNVQGLRIPLEICPLQPYKAKELNGLYYFPILETE